MLISIFWHFHPPYVFFNLFLRHQEWNVALPSRAVVAEKKLSVERLLNENLKTCRKSADKQDSPTFTPRRQARTTQRPPEQFVHPADKRGQDLSLSESPNVNPADIHGQEATPPKIPRTSADIPRMPCFHSPRTMLNLKCVSSNKSAALRNQTFFTTEVHVRF